MKFWHSNVPEFILKMVEWYSEGAAALGRKMPEIETVDCTNNSNWITFSVCHLDFEFFFFSNLADIYFDVRFLRFHG